MRPTLALNYLLCIMQDSNQKNSLDGGALALAFCCWRFCSALQIIFALKSSAPFLMREDPDECMKCGG